MNILALADYAANSYIYRQYQLSHQPPSLEDTEPLLRNFADLKEVLNEVADLGDMNPLTFLSPFLDVIKAQNTNGPITEAALSSVAKFLSYGMIDANSIKAANAVESVAYAVVHTKFIGGKSSGSDECVLYKILLVLRSLLLSPPGALLSNEAVCDMMQSCFRIVFEQHLSPLLRKAAEATLSDMTQLIFTRLPTFHEDARHPYIRKLVMNAKGDKRRRRRRRTDSIAESEKDDIEVVQPAAVSKLPHVPSDIPSIASTDNLTATEKTPLVKAEGDAASLGYDLVLTTNSPCDVVTAPDIPPPEVKRIETVDPAEEKAEEADSEGEDDALMMKETTTTRQHSPPKEAPPAEEDREVQQVGDDEEAEPAGTAVQLPYGLPCCRELLSVKATAALHLPILSGFEIGKRILAGESDVSNSSPERDISEPVHTKPLMPCMNRHAPSHNMPSMEQVIDQKKRKKIIADGTELFNQSPKKGIEFLREKGLLGADATSVVNWLRSNPQLDKKKIADYICSRKHADVGFKNNTCDLQLLC
ncbi:hypothetical protein OESDEN_06770 [Oesophagostomum dentatum]|uniref:SEC7 domain-containing protein n=1 Tax=Oesophagostomum dentatum TaxID=61180 RepID=A0A0B1T6Y1_OESDE|nr:hypothetical protein OESDEN_06770 [Oesophagostomum dentatum]